MRQLLILCLLCAVWRLIAAGNYDAYINALEKRNRQLHEDYLSKLAPGDANFLDELNRRAAQLQATHYLRNNPYGNAYADSPVGGSNGDIDVDNYWRQLTERAGGEDEEKQTISLDDLSDMMDVYSRSGWNRRVEEPYLNKIWGDQRVSGGAGEPGQVTGPQNQPQQAKVKTDKLPTYCNPPNPCPKGADPKKLGAPCSDDVKDTAEFNYADTMAKVQSGQCPCDNEHMECPKISKMPDKKVPDTESINPYLLGNKRDKLDAKKSPRLAVAKRGVRANFKSNVVEKKNPWLDDVDSLDTVEKKDGRTMHAL